MHPMSLPLVSVIIPAYNAADYIDQTLESALAQTYSHIEVLVIDDGSTDQTAEIVQQFVCRDQRVILLHQANAGVAAARNLGIAHAQGEFIAPLDADDIWFPQKLEKQVDCLLDSDPQVGLVYTWSVLLDEAGSQLRFAQTAQLEGDVLIPLIFENFPGNASSPLIRHSSLNVVGDYDSRYKALNAQGCEDWDLYLRIAERYKFRVVPEILVGYRQVMGSMSFNLTQMKNAYEIMVANLAPRHPEIPPAYYQWSIAHFNWYIALKCRYRGDSVGTLQSLFSTVRLDNLYLLHPNLYHLTVISLINFSLKPIKGLLNQSWYFPFWVRPSSDLPKTRNSNQMTLLPENYFNRWLNRRIAHVEKIREQYHLVPEDLNRRVSPDIKP
jgi:glycosyltransferase involved in cell wall biosynthesis